MAEEAEAPAAAASRWRVLAAGPAALRAAVRATAEGLVLDGRGIELLEADPTAAAQAQMRARPAVLVVDAALGLVPHVRSAAGDPAVRILLCGGPAIGRDAILAADITARLAAVPDGDALAAALVAGLRAHAAALRAEEVGAPVAGMLAMTRMLLGTSLNPEQREWVATIHYAGEAVLTGMAAPPAAAPEAATPPGGALRVLVVDDEPINRRVVARLLERDGHAVALAATGGEAVDALAAAAFDVVLMDVRLPDMDGTEATRRMRALPEPGRAATPILALTASLFAGDEARYRAAGMNGALLKPLKLEELHAALSDAGGRAPLAPTSGLPTVDPSRLERMSDIFSPGELARMLDVLATMLATERSLLAEALEAQAWAAVAAATHRIAGAASNYGFAGLVSASRALEDAARAERVLAIPRLGTQIERELDGALRRIDALRRDAGRA